MAAAREFQADAGGRRRYPWPHLKSPVSAVRTAPPHSMLSLK